MHVILGGTGHVGSAAAKALLARGEPVVIVTHDPAKGEDWRAWGAEVAVADVHDPAALRSAFARGRSLFLLNPPAAPSTDTDVEEKRTIAAILEALDGVELEKIVAESTYGAQPGDRCGDLNTLYELEQGLRNQSVPTAINRAAYYFSNWDASLEPVRETGVLRTPYPADLKIPMVAPNDLGEAAARRLVGPVDDVGIRYVEGPEACSAGDVAAAFARALDRPVRVETVPREDWEAMYRDLGFSPAAADSYARMTRVSADKGYETPDAPERGPTTLDAYIAALVSRSS